MAQIEQRLAHRRSDKPNPLRKLPIRMSGKAQVEQEHAHALLHGSSLPRTAASPQELPSRSAASADATVWSLANSHETRSQTPFTPPRQKAALVTAASSPLTRRRTTRMAPIVTAPAGTTNSGSSEQAARPCSTRRKHNPSPLWST